MGHVGLFVCSRCGQSWQSQDELEYHYCPRTRMSPLEREIEDVANAKIDRAVFHGQKDMGRCS